MAQNTKSSREQATPDPPGTGESRLRYADGSIARRTFPENPQLTSALERIETLEDRVGDNSSLTDSSEEVIADVLRKAGENRANEMSRALAPLVVSSMREEIKNSSNEMVSALYPIMGRLVSSYVRGAFVELTQKINKALEDSFSLKRWKIWFTAKITGKSEAEILLSEARPFTVDDLFVVHRKSGLLIARAEEADPNAPDADLVGAMLTAIMSFVEDAFQDDADSTLQAISFGDSRLLVRTTPTLVLAAKITGIQPIEFEDAFDEAVLAFADRWGQDLINFDGGSILPDQPELVRDLQSITGALPIPDFAETASSADAGTGGPSIPKSPLRRFGPPVLAALSVIALIFWWAGESGEDRTLRHIAASLEEDENLRRFPLKPLVDDGQFVVRGWVPDKATLGQLKATLAPHRENQPIALDVFTPEDQ